jgi:hypothetical protein
MTNLAFTSRCAIYNNQRVQMREHVILASYLFLVQQVVLVVVVVEDDLSILCRAANFLGKQLSLISSSLSKRGRTWAYWSEHDVVR